MRGAVSDGEAEPGGMSLTRLSNSESSARQLRALSSEVEAKP